MPELTENQIIAAQNQGATDIPSAKRATDAAEKRAADAAAEKDVQNPNFAKPRLGLKATGGKTGLTGVSLTNVSIWRVASMDIVELEHADGPSYIKFRHGLCEVGGDMNWGTGDEVYEASEKPASAAYPKQMYKGSYTADSFNGEQKPVKDAKEEKSARKDGFVDGHEFFSKPRPAEPTPNKSAPKQPTPQPEPVSPQPNPPQPVTVGQPKE